MKFNAVTQKAVVEERIYLSADLTGSGGLRLEEIIGTENSKQGKPKETGPYYLPLVNCSKSHLYQLIRDGKFPAPRKFGTRMSLWHKPSVREALAGAWGA